MMEGEEEGVSSECISGSQSGWTSYLNHSSCNSPDLHVHNNGGSFQHVEEEEEEEEEAVEEDLSMVSDASSKPPHFHVEDEHCNCSSLTPPSQWVNNGSKKKRRLEPSQQREQQQHFTSSLLDDTASSPLFTLHSKDMKPPPMEEESFLEFSCAFSATHFKRNQALEKQMDYLNPQRNQQDQYQGKEGRRNGE